MVWEEAANKNTKHLIDRGGVGAGVFLGFCYAFFLSIFLLLLLYVSIAAAYIVWLFFAGFLFDFSVLLCCVFCRLVLS